MNLLPIWRYLFPPPRQPFRWLHALPLAIFLVLFGITCVVLEQSRIVVFTNYSGFLALIAAPWVVWMYLSGLGGLRHVRGQVALALRLIMVGLLAMVLADPRSVRESNKLSVVYAVDVSDSIGMESVDKALEFVVQTAQKKSPEDDAGLVVFARDAAVELPPRPSFPFEALNSRLPRDATDLAKSLALAAAMLPEENLGRIVLVTDGMETEGALEPVLEDLRARKVGVDVLPISYQYDQEVWLERLELPRFVKLGESYDTGIILSSLQSGAGTLVLLENGTEVARSPIDFVAGKNRYTIPIRLRQPGYYEYTAVVEPASGVDHLRENNAVVNSIFIRGEGRILLVTNPQGNPRDWESLRGDLQATQRIVDVKSALEMPDDPMSFMPYDAVLLVNVPADAFDSVQMKTLRDIVFDLGIGLAMIGGDESFGAGGYRRTPVEEALPVDMDVTQKKILPKGALAIILHTCEFAEGNTYGKRIAREAIKVMSEQDEAGVLVYGTAGEQWLFELTPVSQYAEMAKKIAGAEIGDMPSFATTMQLGLEGLKKSDAAAKHMIVISDGDPSPPPPELISQFQSEKISVTMVAIFPHGGGDVSKMRAIADVTGGRYYFPSDAEQLPAIFIKEAKTLQRNLIQNKEVLPEANPLSSVVRGITSMPSLKGYVLTTPKARATTVLQVKVEQGGEEQIDPILATWRFGLGASAAFTSDLAPNWAANWTDWPQRRALVAQLITEIARVQAPNHLHVWTEVQGNEGVIVVEDHHPDDAFLNIAARVAGPRDRNETITLKQSGPRRYQTTMPLWGKGRYQIMVTAQGDGRSEQVPANWILPYSPEYLRFRSNPLVLDRIREVTRGSELDAASDAQTVFDRRETKRSTRPIFDWLLAALACLVPIDVAVRRIQIDFWALRQWLWRKGARGASTQTMGTLLERTKEVRSQLDTRPIRTSAPRPIEKRPGGTPPPPTGSGTSAAGTTAASPPPAEVDTPPHSTTERLLHLKRKRDKQDP